MNILGDFEIIRTSLMMGDIRDVMWKIDSARNRANASYYATKNVSCSDYVKLLDALKSVLSGEGSLTGLRTIMLSDSVRELLPEVDMEKYSESFLFMLEYSIDRYNVTYPAYDEKRCGDA